MKLGQVQQGGMKRRAGAVNLHNDQLGSSAAPIKTVYEIWAQSRYAMAAWLSDFPFPAIAYGS